MQIRFRGVRAAISMGITWASAWAIGGVMIGVASLLLPFLPWDYFFRIFDAPLPLLALPGFVGGALFSVVLRIAGRNRRFDELSLPRFTFWGALGGLLLSLVPAAMVGAGLASMGGGSAFSVWQLTAVIAVPLTLFSAASAAGSLQMARKGERSALESGTASPEIGDSMDR